MEALLLIAALLLCVCIVLPIVALVRTNRIHSLELRLAGVEAALLRLTRQQQPVAAAAVEAPVEEPPVRGAPPVVAGPLPVAEIVATAVPAPSAPVTQNLEAVIGQKWVGWIAVLLILSLIHI